MTYSCREIAQLRQDRHVVEMVAKRETAAGPDFVGRGRGSAYLEQIPRSVLVAERPPFSLEVPLDINLDG